MTTPELLALSLALSVAAAALGLAITRALERRVADPVLRERAWAAALYVPTLPPLVVSLMLLTPAPLATAAPVGAAAIASSVAIELPVAQPVPPLDLAHTASILVLVLAGLFALLKIVSLGVRLMRLRKLVRATTAASPNLRRTVEDAARTIGAPVPAVRIAGSGAEAMLAGLRRPVLILPAAFADRPESATTRAVCAHELAHLRRGDHRALWIEEILLAIAAINPLLRVIRDHRAAAREEACDAVALAGVATDQRRLYARSLLNAVQTAGFQRTAPALTFTSARRTFVMNRLKAVLVPASPAAPRSRRAVVGLSALVAGLACAGSFAVAGQRQPIIVEAPTAGDQPALATAAPVRPEALASPVPTALPAPVPAVSATPQPQPVVAAEPAEAAARLPSASLAQESPPPAEITRVTWSQHPTPMYPAVAAANGVTEGTVTLSCLVEADGRASDCTVLTESPEGAGFGEAALASMETARFSPGTGAPGARARFTIRFRVAG